MEYSGVGEFGHWLIAGLSASPPDEPFGARIVPSVVGWPWCQLTLVDSRPWQGTIPFHTFLTEACVNCSDSRDGYLWAEGSVEDGIWIQCTRLGTDLMHACTSGHTDTLARIRIRKSSPCLHAKQSSTDHGTFRGQTAGYPHHHQVKSSFIQLTKDYAERLPYRQG